MKKFLCLLLITVFALSGCGKDSAVIGGADEPTNILVMPKDDWGIAMHAEDVTPTGVKVVCEQSGGSYKGELQTGTPWTLEYEENGEWKSVPTISGDELVWTMIAQKINENQTTEWYMDFSMHYEPLTAGKYRIGKVITDFKGDGDYASRTYYANFTIEAE